MRKIKISNISTLSCVPYKLLQSISAIEYTDGTPTENALKLREGEVDAALIPVVDFAQEGSFVGLDFGMGCRQRTDSMILYANQPIRLLKTIHIYESSRSSMFLLKIILKEKWNISPRFVRHKGYELFNWLGDYEGVLGLHRLPGQIRNSFPVVVDLSSAWYQHTGLPFLYLVWAARPGVFNADQLLTLNQAFYKSARASRSIAQEFSEYYGTHRRLGSGFVGDNRRFYIDDFLLRGLKEFYRRANNQNLLPRSEYRGAKLTLLKRSVTKSGLRKSINSILDDASNKRRISFYDAYTLAKKAPYEDLLAAARVSIKAGGPIEIVKTLNVNPQVLQQDRSALRNLEREIEGYSSVRLSFPKQWPLAAGLTMTKILGEHRKLKLEAYSILGLHESMQSSGLEVEQVCKQLREAGLSSVLLESGDLLRYRDLNEQLDSKHETQFSSLPNVIQSGLKATAQVQIASFNSWIARLKYLGKLRTVQDELAGFTGLEIVSKDPVVPFSELVRAKIISQFYLSDLDWTFYSDCEEHILAEITEPSLLGRSGTQG